MVIILGLGFTGQRLARRLLRRGGPAFAAVRGVERFGDLAGGGLLLTELRPEDPGAFLPRNGIIAHLIPPLPVAENSALRAMIEKLEPRRIVYVSSTGVYGEQVQVNAETPAKPSDERGRLRYEEEQWIASGPWTSLILRAAGIYGPGRGVHAAVRQGKMPRSAGSGIVSRIHADDLAAIIEAGIFSQLQGAWPVADDAPCSSEEIAAWCYRVFMPGGANQAADPTPFRGKPITGRHVDGTGIRATLGVELTWPSWDTGVPASIAEEETNRDPD